ncbi:MAG: hypothetical protein GPJ54_14765 [Candidatus Heimdallarchaeota archaeon]|nr:hypothetical protein [Candidatus Heimdallarchaeota archaeon]
MLSKVWESYLDRIIPIQTINKLLVYTDLNREWIANPLVDLGMDLDWKVSMAFTDDFEEGDMNDIKTSLLSLAQDTLIISLISFSNPNLDKLNSIFPYNGKISGIAGICIIFSPELPDSFILDFLRTDNYEVIERLEKMLIKASVNRTMEIKSFWGTNLQFVSNDICEIPNIIYDGENSPISFPGMVVKVDVVPGTFIGDMVVYGLILPYYDSENNIVDHYGNVAENARFKLSFLNGRITGMEMIDECKDEFIYKRFKKLIGKLVNDNLNLQVSFGIGHCFHKPPGIAIVDRNLQKSFEIKLNDEVTIILYDIELE